MKLTPVELRPLSILRDLPEELIHWLLNNANHLELAVADVMFSKDQSADFMYIIISGSVQRYEEIGGQLLLVDILAQGQVTGMLPYSRMTHYPGPAVALEATRVLRIAKKDFPAMLALSQEFGQRLIAEMSNRVRGGVRLEQQREKMASLGKLSAGLAHEINNPASAISRTAERLNELFARQSTLYLVIAGHPHNQNTVDLIEKYISWTSVAGKEKITALQRSEREEQLADWMENKGITKAWDLAHIFAETSMSLSDFDQLAQTIPGDIISEAIELIAGSNAIAKMIDEIHMAAKDITGLVSSIKVYSHMDQSPEYKQTDISRSLDDTLKMFGYILKQKNIGVNRDYQKDLPTVQANAAELNQVWTHLIENAIDAMDEGGELSLMAGSNNMGVQVRVIDNGSGIAKEIQQQIFDPFFTTKEVGQGTGLGLDIARRILNQHRGQIEVQSKPGRTEMLIFIPYNH